MIISKPSSLMKPPLMALDFTYAPGHVISIRPAAGSVVQRHLQGRGGPETVRAALRELDWIRQVVEELRQ